MRSAIRLSLTENAQNIPRCAKTRIKVLLRKANENRRK